MHSNIHSRQQHQQISRKGITEIKVQLLIIKPQPPPTTHRLTICNQLRSDKHRRFVCDKCLMKVSGVKEKVVERAPSAPQVIIVHQGPPSSGPPSSGGLPPGWEQGIDPASGRPYYINPLTRSSQWEPPTPMAMGPPPSVGVPPPASPAPRPSSTSLLFRFNPKDEEQVF